MRVQPAASFVFNIGDVAVMPDRVLQGTHRMLLFISREYPRLKCRPPPIPADVRVKTSPADIVCWEVDRWYKESQVKNSLSFSVLDPVILRHSSHDMYIVIAEWDLTPIEQKLFGSLS